MTRVSRNALAMGLAVLATATLPGATTALAAPAMAAPARPAPASPTVAPEPGDPVALLVRLAGDVKVQPAGSEASVAGSIGMALRPGDRVLVADGAHAVILYRTGKLVKAAAAVTVEAVEDGASSSLFASTVKTLADVATTDARTQPNRQGMIRPLAGAPGPIAPRNGLAVLDVRPTFTWFAAPAAGGYVVQIQRQGEQGGPPVRYPVGHDTTWTLPSTAPPLVPGATYAWTVGAADGGRVAAPQSFTVVPAATFDALQRSLHELVDTGIDPAGDGLFLAALAYRDAGLFYEAARALGQVEAEGLATGRAFLMLKGEILDALGRVDAAAAAFRQADEAAGS